MCHWQKWIWPGLLTVFLVSAAALWLKSAVIQDDLTQRAQATFSASGLNWAKISLDGRDAVLTGEAPDEQAKTQAFALAGSLYDVRVVTNGATLQARQSPYTLSVMRSGSAFELKGYIPSEKQREKTIDSLKRIFPNASISDDLEIARGEPDGFQDYFNFGLGQLFYLENGEFGLSDSSYSIKGLAKDFASYDEVERTTEANLPAGASLAVADITAPSVSPYLWSAEFDGKQVSLKGYVPDNEVGKELFNAVFAALPDASIINDQRIAGGAPEEFADAAKFAVAQLRRFESGSVALKDTALKVVGKAKTTESYTDALRTLAAPLPGKLNIAGQDIQPPLVDSFFWSASYFDNKLSLVGFVPGEKQQQAILADAKSRFPDATVEDQTKIATGAPARFGDAARFSLEQLSNMTKGSVALTDTDLSIEGDAKTRELFDAAKVTLAKKLPQGFAVKKEEIAAPPVSPYIWSAIQGDKTLTLLGYAPDEAARKAIAEKAEAAIPGSKVVDEMRIGRGAADDFQSNVDFSLTQLGFLSPGSVSLTDEKFSIEGAAIDTDGYQTIAKTIDEALPGDLALASSNIRPAKISPYIWAAKKDGENVSLSGFISSEKFRITLKNNVKSSFPKAVIDDQLKIAAGAPENFVPITIAAFAALQRFIVGEVLVSDQTVEVNGTAKSLDDFAAADKFATEGLASGIPVAKANIQPSQAKNGYVWSALRTKDAIIFSGSMPSKQERSTMVEEAAKLFPNLKIDNKMVLESGEPDDFIQTTQRAMALLGYLTEGAVRLNNGELSVEGAAGTAADYEKAIGETRASVWGAFTWVKRDIIAPPTKPFLWSFSREGDAASLKGHVPSTEKAKALLRAANRATNASVFNNQKIAAGQPSGFDAAAEAGIVAVGKLDNGSVVISDIQVTVKGVADSEGTATTIRKDLETKVPANFRLKTEFSFPIQSPATKTPDAKIDGNEVAVVVPQPQKPVVTGPKPYGVPEPRPPYKFETSDREAPEPPKKVVVARCNVNFRRVFAGQKIRFARGRAVIRRSSYRLLNRLTRAAKSCPQTRFEVSGHTDRQGRAGHNRRLSEARARAVVAHLVRAGVDAKNLVPRGYGSRKPAATNRTARGRARNRRIDFRIIK